jgi:uncharacterized protein YjaG (DUF416 family)
MLSFDQKELLNDLAELPTILRTTFAAACAQRLLPNYVRYADNGARNTNPAAVSNALATLWRMIESNRFDAALLTKEYELCVSLMPDAYKQYIQGHEEALDAVLSIAFAIRAQVDADDVELAVSAARQAVNALDHYIYERYGINIGAPGAQQKIDAYPIMQIELRRQQVDIAELQSVMENPDSEPAIISRIRRRAEQDAAPLDQLPLDQLRAARRPLT